MPLEVAIRGTGGAMWRLNKMDFEGAPNPAPLEIETRSIGIYKCIWAIWRLNKIDFEGAPNPAPLGIETRSIGCRLWAVG